MAIFLACVGACIECKADDFLTNGCDNSFNIWDIRYARVDSETNSN